MMNIIRDFIIYKDENSYCAFPCITRCQNGDLLVCFRQAPREEHAHHHHSMSRAVTVRSRDDGLTWDETYNYIARDDDIGQQDPHVTTLDDGSIFAAYFTWQSHPETENAGIFDAHGELSVGVKNCIWRCCGVHTAISKDNGYTWKTYGKITLPNAGRHIFANAAMHSKAVQLGNRLLLPIRVEAPDSYKHYLIESFDGGASWNYVCEMLRAPCEKHHYYDEGFLYLTPSGKLICVFRCYDEGGLMEYIVSGDEGYTWGKPIKTNVWGYPQTIAPLSGGRTLLTYGYRRDPWGARARILDAELNNIDAADEIIIYDKGRHADLGYPSGIELNDGSILITYYCSDLNDGIFMIKGTVIK